MAGFKTEEKIYLAVWCLKGEKNIAVPISDGIKSVRITYPTKHNTQLSVKNDIITLGFATDKNALFLEIDY